MVSGPAALRHIACSVFRAVVDIGAEEVPMDPMVWLPIMFLTGLAGMGVCLAFAIVCEKI